MRNGASIAARSCSHLLARAWLAAAVSLPAVAQQSEHAGHAAPAPTADTVTADERAAAFPDLGGMRMSDMMLADPLNRLVLLDRLETHDASGGNVLSWDLDAWVGRDLGKLWIRSEGDRQAGRTERAELELLWGKAFAPWWDLVAGARTDFAPGDERSWAAVGVRGLAPYRFDLEATAYVGDGGRAALRFETTYEVLVTNRLVLQPLVGIDWYAQSDAARLAGAGLAEAELGVRLRYEFRREVAPYVGLTHERKFGRTADFARAVGSDTEDTRLVAGIRLWF
jgi:copper resistance protein B